MEGMARYFRGPARDLSAFDLDDQMKEVAERSAEKTRRSTCRARVKPCQDTDGRFDSRLGRIV